MYKCRRATWAEEAHFRRRFCQRDKARLSLIHFYRIDIEAFETLPPWYGTPNAARTKGLLHDSVIMLRVSDPRERISYYPVFNEAIGKRLLAAWELPVPPKMSALRDSQRSLRLGQHVGVAPDNISLRSLLAFARWSMLQQGQHPLMAEGFNTLYQQLHVYPELGVAPEALLFVNEVIGSLLAQQQRTSLQSFVSEVKAAYPLLNYRITDYSALRRRLHEGFPEVAIHF